MIIWDKQGGVTMTDEAIVVTLISSIISGVLATAITLYINYRNEQLKIKRKLVDDVFGYRYQLLGWYDGDKSAINNALNRIPIVFNHEKDVLKAYDEFYDVTTAVTNPNEKAKKCDDKLVTLYKEMCKAAGFKVDSWNDSRIKNVFAVMNSK